jgi:hypothetical protein
MGNELVKGRNTESFDPDYRPANMTVRVCLSEPKCDLPYRSGDVILVPHLFDPHRDYFTPLLREIEASGNKLDLLWKKWHGDTHLIADDKLDWKSKCPTFLEVVEKMRHYFDLDVQATRFNLYRKGEWKPYHHDAAAVDASKADRQNITVAASFGATREISFQYAKTGDPIESRATVSFPLPNGTVYTFGAQVNVDWRHGVLPVLKDQSAEAAPPSEGTPSTDRISIIIWGGGFP